MTSPDYARGVEDERRRSRLDLLWLAGLLTALAIGCAIGAHHEGIRQGIELAIEHGLDEPRNPGTRTAR